MRKIKSAFVLVCFVVLGFMANKTSAMTSVVANAIMAYPLPVSPLLNPIPILLMEAAFCDWPDYSTVVVPKSSRMQFSKCSLDAQGLSFSCRNEKKSFILAKKWADDSFSSEELNNAATECISKESDPFFRSIYWYTFCRLVTLPIIERLIPSRAKKTYSSASEDSSASEMTKRIFQYCCNNFASINIIGITNRKETTVSESGRGAAKSIISAAARDIKAISMFDHAVTRGHIWLSPNVSNLNELRSFASWVLGIRCALTEGVPPVHAAFIITNPSINADVFFRAILNSMMQNLQEIYLRAQNLESNNEVINIIVPIQVPEKIAIAAIIDSDKIFSNLYGGSKLLMAAAKSYVLSDQSADAAASGIILAAGLISNLDKKIFSESVTVSAISAINIRIGKITKIPGITSISSYNFSIFPEVSKSGAFPLPGGIDGSFSPSLLQSVSFPESESDKSKLAILNSSNSLSSSGTFTNDDFPSLPVVIPISEPSSSSLNSSASSSSSSSKVKSSNPKKTTETTLKKK
jgi:hypothetical protein